MKVKVSPEQFYKHYRDVQSRNLQQSLPVIKYTMGNVCELYFNDGFETLCTEFITDESAVVFLSNFSTIIQAQERPEVC